MRKTEQMSQVTDVKETNDFWKNLFRNEKELVAARRADAIIQPADLMFQKSEGHFLLERTLWIIGSIANSVQITLDNKFDLLFLCSS